MFERMKRKGNKEWKREVRWKQRSRKHRKERTYGFWNISKI